MQNSGSGQKLNPALLQAAQAAAAGGRPGQPQHTPQQQAQMQQAQMALQQQQAALVAAQARAPSPAGASSAIPPAAPGATRQVRILGWLSNPDGALAFWGLPPQCVTGRRGAFSCRRLSAVGARFLHHPACRAALALPHPRRQQIPVVLTVPYQNPNTGLTAYTQVQLAPEFVAANADCEHSMAGCSGYQLQRLRLVSCRTRRRRTRAHAHSAGPLLQSWRSTTTQPTQPPTPSSSIGTSRGFRRAWRPRQSKSRQKAAAGWPRP